MSNVFEVDYDPGDGEHEVTGMEKSIFWSCLKQSGMDVLREDVLI